MRRILPYAAMLAAAGCLGLPGGPGLAPPTALPEQVDAPPPLVLHCQAAEVDQQQLTATLIDERRAIAVELGLPDATPPLHVYLFADRAGYEAHVAAKFPDFPSRRAIFVRDRHELAVYAYSSEYLEEDLRHEATHGYLHAILPTLPLWLDEGLAEYYEILPEEPRVNLPHVALLAAQRRLQNWAPDLAALEQLSDAGAMTQLEYAESWLWVHWLLQTPGDSQVLRSYLSDLQQGVANPPLSQRLPPQAATRVAQHLQSLTPLPE